MYKGNLNLFRWFNSLMSIWHCNLVGSLPLLELCHKSQYGLPLNLNPLLSSALAQPQV